MPRFLLLAALSTAACSSAPSGRSRRHPQPSMNWGDTECRHVPFAKDPSVIWFGGHYLLYYSIPTSEDGRQNDWWAIGIAASTDLVHWSRVGRILTQQPYQQKGLVNGRVILLGDAFIFSTTPMETELVTPSVKLSPSMDCTSPAIPAIQSCQPKALGIMAEPLIAKSSPFIANCASTSLPAIPDCRRSARTRQSETMQI